MPRPVSDPDDLDMHAVQAANMLVDPCNANLVPTVYNGDRGYINRFNSAFSAGNGTGETCWMLAFKPGIGVMWNIGDASSSTNKTIGYSDTQFPGAGFLNSNATKARTAGFCVTLRPNSAPNTATGQIYYGIIPSSVLVEGGTVNADNAIRLCTESVSVAQTLMQPLEIRWSPGIFDEKYAPVSSITSDDDSDRNTLVVVGVGFPAASGTNVRATVIHEWSSNVNVLTDATNVKPSRCDINCVLRNLKRKDPSWWWSLGKKVVKAGKDVTLAYYAGGPIGATTALAKYL